MPVISSPTPFAIGHYRKLGYLGVEIGVLAVRASFKWCAPGEPFRLAERQSPLRWGETYAGPSGQILRSTVAEDTDCDYLKPTTDIHLSGHLVSPTGKAMRDWCVGVRVGTVKKMLRVHGPRQFERSLGRWRLGHGEAVERITLDYRQAFGGLYVPSRLHADESPEAYVCHEANPAGCGWLPDSQDLKALDKADRKDIDAQIKQLTTLAAPRFEALDRPIRSPMDRHAPEGFGPIARWWSPRKDRQGTMDAAWQRYRAPEWPVDFDAHYFNSAHPDLIAPAYFGGDEHITLINCTARSNRRTDGDRVLDLALPGLGMFAACKFPDRIQTFPMLLDTVGIDLDAQALNLTWHLALPDSLTGGHPIEEILIGAADLDTLRQAQPARQRHEEAGQA